MRILGTFFVVAFLVTVATYAQAQSPTGPIPLHLTYEETKTKIALASNADTARDALVSFTANHGTRADLPQLRSLLKAFLKRFADSPETPSAVLAISETHEAIDDEASWALMRDAVASSQFARNDPNLLIELAYAANLRGETSVAEEALAKAMRAPLSDHQKARALLAKAIAFRDKHQMSEAQRILQEARAVAMRDGSSGGILSIINDFTSPGHSFDPAIEHKPIPQPEPRLSPLLATGLTGSFIFGLTGGAMALARRHRSRSV